MWMSGRLLLLQSLALLLLCSTGVTLSWRVLPSGLSSALLRSVLVQDESTSTSSVNDDVITSSPAVCVDGVCSLPPAPTPLTDLPAPPAVNETLEAAKGELLKLGWAEEDVRLALQVCEGDFTAAAELLEEAQEHEEALDAAALRMESEHGWSRSLLRAALNETSLNETAALQLVEEEELRMLAEFEGNVNDMVENGWDELVARQALLRQWVSERQREAGMNTTQPRELLDRIRPTYKVPPQPPRETETAPSSPAVETKQAKEELVSEKSIPPTPSPPAPVVAPVPESEPAPVAPAPAPAPVPAKVEKEDVVFEVTAKNLQQVVLESPVPVLLDVYADWCGPCKQLAPLLENAAIKGGGSFRVAKVNVDTEKALAECLDVSGLPAVFAVVKGRVTDRFVGMIDSKRMIQFILRAVSGGPPSKETPPRKTLEDWTRRLTNAAGFASIDFKTKESISANVEQATQLDDAFTVSDDGGISPSPGVRVVQLYIDNAIKDIQNEKFRKIPKSSKTFATKVACCPAALKLLKIAGFEESQDSWELSHNNAAILSLVGQKLSKVINERRFAKMTGGTTSWAAKEQQREKTASKDVAPSSEKKKQQSGSSSVKIVFRGRTSSKKEAVLSKHVLVKRKTTLRSALASLLSSSFPSLLEDSELQLMIKFPLPLRPLSPKSKELDRTVGELVESGSDELTLITTDRNNPSKTAKSPKAIKKPTDKPKVRKGATNTLSSMGILSGSKKKNNEYFGGDSTVTSAGDEDDDE